jgi:hypothetical protein
MSLDAELEKTLRRDCMEFFAAYKDTARLQVGSTALYKEYMKTQDAVLKSLQRERDADKAIQYRLNTLELEDYEDGLAIVKGYMPDLADAPLPEEVVKVAWLNQLGGSDGSDNENDSTKGVAPEDSK